MKGEIIVRDLSKLWAALELRKMFNRAKRRTNWPKGGHTPKEPLKVWQDEGGPLTGKQFAELRLRAYPALSFEPIELIKVMESLQDQIAVLAQKLADEITEKKKTDTAVLSLVSEAQTVNLAIAGDIGELVTLVARAVSQTPELGDILRAGIKAAPFVEAFFGDGVKTEDCPCAKCVARRERNAKDPNVN